MVAKRRRHVRVDFESVRHVDAEAVHAGWRVLLLLVDSALAENVYVTFLVDGE